MSGLWADVIGWFGDASRWSVSDPSGIGYRVIEHLTVSTVAMLIAIALAIPTALVLAHHRRAEAIASAIVNLGRAVPSFGLIVVFWLVATYIPTVSPRFWPLVGALVALAIPPVFTNTYTSVRDVDADIVEAARGMGATEHAVMFRTELPLASPVIVAGVRLAYVQVIATTAIGAIVTNGGGLGRYIVDGFAIGRAGHAMVVSGALLLGVLTLAADRVLAAAEVLVVPTPLREISTVRVEGVTGAAG